MTSDVQECVMPDGSLYSLGWYLGWSVGDKSITLDGEFTVEDLEAIITHIKANS